jgi:hypothetical protein
MLHSNYKIIQVLLQKKLIKFNNDHWLTLWFRENTLAEFIYTPKSKRYNVMFSQSDNLQGDKRLMFHF